MLYICVQQIDINTSGYFPSNLITMQMHLLLLIKLTAFTPFFPIYSSHSKTVFTVNYKTRFDNNAMYHWLNMQVSIELCEQIAANEFWF